MDQFNYVVILTLGLTSIISYWLIFVFDVMVNIEGMNGESFWGPLSKLPSNKLLCCVYALFLFPFLLFPLFLLYKGFLPLGNCLSIFPSLLLGFSFSTVCVVLHTSYYYYAIVSQQIIKKEKETMLFLLNQFDKFKDIIGKIFFILFAISYLLIFLIIITGKSIYPFWLALINPIIGIFLYRIIIKIFPNFKLKLLPAFWQALFMTIIVIYHLYVF